MDRFYNGKLLKTGYTTGSCATAASKAALAMLLSKKVMDTVQITVPTGQKLSLEVLNISRSDDTCSCAIRKDGGDDPDATHNMLIYSTVSLVPSKGKRKILIDGGEGVGRVTLKGLDQKVGNAAINSVPRSMIDAAVLDVLNECDESLIQNKDVSVVISIPNGEEVARRTFNPHLGIVGGLSILGTTGIVDPMSSSALIATFKTELSVFKEQGIKNFSLVLGNYGLNFAENDLNIELKPYVMCSNYLGDTLDCAIENKMEDVLLVAHIGKLVKCAVGILNTHSRNGDGRIDAFIKSALVCGASLSCLREIEKSATTDAILQVLIKYEILEEVLLDIKRRVVETINRRTYGFLNVEIICFTKADIARERRMSFGCEALDKNSRVLFYTENAASLMKNKKDC